MGIVNVGATVSGAIISSGLLFGIIAGFKEWSERRRHELPSQGIRLLRAELAAERRTPQDASPQEYARQNAETRPPSQ